MASFHKKRIACPPPPHSAIGSIKNKKPQTLMPEGGNVAVLETPSYEQIFRPPKLNDRDKNKKYGKHFLLEFCRYNQNEVYCANHRIAKCWLEGHTIHHDLRHKKEEQNKLMDIIDANRHTILPLEFPGASYMWKREDIYIYLRTTLAARRKHQKAKAKTKGLSMDSLLSRSTSFMELLNGSTEVTHNAHDEDDINKELQNENVEIVVARKSNRTRKMTDKMQSNVESRKTSHENKKQKKMKDLGSIKDSERAHSLSQHERVQSSRPMTSSIQTFGDEDQETILMKFFDIQNINELYVSLKSSFNIVKRDATFQGDRKEQNPVVIKKLIVDWLVYTKKIVITRSANNALSLDDVLLAE